MLILEVLLADVLLQGLGAEAARFGRFVVNGVVVGSILALAGVGLTLVYGILRIANFAHGDFLTLGAYMTLYLAALVTFPRTIAWAVGVALVLVALVAADRFVRPWLLHPLRRSRRGSTFDLRFSRRLLSPRESRLLLLGALVLLVLVAGVLFPASLADGLSLLIVVLVASVPLVVETARADRDRERTRTLGLWAGVGLLVGLAAHFLVPLQTAPGGFSRSTEIALAIGVFAAGLLWSHRGLARRMLPGVGFVAGFVVLLYLFADLRILALAVSLAVVSAVMVFLELTMWRRARRQGAGLLTLIIIAIGLMLLLRNVIIIIWGTRQQAFPGTLLPRVPILGSDVGITPYQSLVVVVALATILAMHLFLRYTKVGKAMRALADDMDLARVSGIDVDRVVVYVWILAGALAALAGTLYAFTRPFDTNLGWFQVLPIFAAVILGGIGSPYGAMLGGYTIGLVMEVGPFFGVPVEYKLVMAFAALILVMVFRPKGLMGGGATR